MEVGAQGRRKKRRQINKAEGICDEEKRQKETERNVME